MIGKPTLIVQTTWFPVSKSSGLPPLSERADAHRLGEDLYAILTRSPDDALAWGAGIPVRVATEYQRIDFDEAEHVVVIPVLGRAAQIDGTARSLVVKTLNEWNRPGRAARVLPVFASADWRTEETKIPKPLLTELYAAHDHRRTTLNEILLALARLLSPANSLASQLFISHAKVDLAATGSAAEEIRKYVSGETTGKAFFDRVSLVAGDDLTVQIERGLESGVFVAVRGDLYSSRSWCRQELLRAKQQRLPTLVVEVLSSGERRSAIYAGNGPTVVWDRTAPEAAAARVATLAMAEAVRHLHFAAESKRVIVAAELPPSTECLSRAPELLDIVALRRREDARLVVLHPDPPLPTFERTLLEDGDKRVRTVTPTTAFSGAIGSSIHAPLDGWEVALSLSTSPDAPKLGGMDGLTTRHVQDATAFLARGLVGAGAAIAYGGDFRRVDGFTRLLAQIVVEYNETGRENADRLRSYLGVPIDPMDGDGVPFTAISLRGDERARLPVPDLTVPLPPHRSALHFSDMRWLMAEATAARVVLGGDAIPRSEERKGYGGVFPGVVEEAWRTLQVGKPLYVAGGFGGAGALVVDALQNEEAPPGLCDDTWDTNARWKALAASIAADPDHKRLGLPKTQRELAAAIRSLGKRCLASNDSSLAWNGLTLAENRALFRTRDPLTLTALVLKGLITVSTRAAAGKLRIELVEGDIAAASDLELLIFPVFDDVTLDGAGAALDRASGGAATRARSHNAVVATGSRTLGADFLYAANLGKLEDAVKDVRGRAQHAAEAAAQVVRRQRVQRVGIVTFFGNVASLKEPVDGMLAGLQHLGGSKATAPDVVWFERDPARAALLADLLNADERVSFTRRAAPVPEVPVVAERTRRTQLTVRYEDQTLRITLLLDRANGLAPSFSVELSEEDLKQLVGKDEVPTAAELTQRGDLIATLLFGGRDSNLIEQMGASEIVINHDLAASSIPFETMGWSIEKRVLNPALEGGVVRRLMIDGIAAHQGLPRRAPARGLGVVVVIDPTENLPGAVTEGNALVRHLESKGFRVEPLRGKQATVKAVRTLLADPGIDVFHYCGHAFFHGPTPSQSGLVCNDRALTLKDLEGDVPRFVFMNACQSARVRGAELTSQDVKAFAEFFLKARVDAYLGTFWLVSDKGAAEFAGKVYSALGEGLTLGEAVVAGRRTLHEGSRRDWANYHLYGDTSFRMVGGVARSASLETAVPSPTVRVEDKTLVASWPFLAKDAPTSFAAAVVDGAGLPVRVADDRAMSVERREDWVGTTAIVTWVVTVVLDEPPSTQLELRPTAGAVLQVPLAVGAQRAADAPTRSATDSAIETIRTLLVQQPDEGHAFLHALHGSDDPWELRARIEASAKRGSPVGEEQRAFWPFHEFVKPHVDAAALAAFVSAYDLPPIDTEEAAATKFQTKEDWKNYVCADGAIQFVTGNVLLPPIWPTLSDPASALTHEVRADEFTDGIEVALFADNGNGLYAARQVANQIVRSKLPYAFHLGDVYYGGAEAEFREYFHKPLSEMFDRTELFMLTGNHEMFALGAHYQGLIQDKQKNHEQRQRQNGEMFRLRWKNPAGGPGFQILGIDTMYVGWNERRLRLHDKADEAVLGVLRTWLKEHPDDLTILMTTNEPWDKGSTQLTPLYESMKATIAGRVDLWFWGNVHYAALFEPWAFPDAGSPKRQLIGSCIGHGGYPFYTQTSVGDLPQGVGCRWLEENSRFWPDSRIRPDVGANGWCRLALKRAANRWNVGLTFIDWVGRPRLRANLVREDDGSIRFEDVSESDASEVGSALTWKAKAVEKTSK